MWLSNKQGSIIAKRKKISATYFFKRGEVEKGTEKKKRGCAKEKEANADMALARSCGRVKAGRKFCSWGSAKEKRSNKKKVWGTRSGEETPFSTKKKRGNPCE